MTLLNWLRPTPAATKPAPRPRLGVQQLEAREVPAADLLSAFGAGTDAGSSSASDLAVDASGNSFLTGTFSGTVDFDPAHTFPEDTDILTAQGTTDVFVAKYAPDGALVWARRMGGPGVVVNDRLRDYDSARSIAVNANGTVVVAGNVLGTADFGASAAAPVVLTSTGGTTDGFVAVLDTNGLTRWAKVSGAGVVDNSLGAGVDSAGNVFTLTFANETGYTISKYGSSGAVAWQRQVGTSAGLWFGDLAVDPAGNTYTVGCFGGTIDLDPGTRTRYFVSGASNSVFALKLDTKGNYVWANSLVTERSGTRYGQAFPSAVAVDGGGNVFVGGQYNGDLVDFQSGAGRVTLPPNGGGFVAKFSPAGGLAWARGFEDDGTTTGNDASVWDLATDASGNVYATGSYLGGVDLDPGAGQQWRTATPSGEVYTSGTMAGQPIRRYDVFVVKLTSSGTLAWAEAFGGSGDDAITGVGVDPAGVVHLAGGFRRTVDFDPNPNVAFDLTAPEGKSSLFLVLQRRLP